jgi:hypothetical protein
MTTFNYSEYCIERFLQTFSNLKDNPQYKEDVEEALAHEKGAHDLYERVLCAYVLNMIKQKKLEDSQKIKEVFQFIEELMQHEDFEVRCVAKVSFIEPLLDKIEPTKEIEKYLGPFSLEAARNIGSFRFGLNPITWENKN